MTPFGTRLRTRTSQRGPLCAGIDPHPSLLAAWGLNDDVAGLERFTMTAVEALAGTVAVLKPQSAFFERHGSAGVGVLERAVRAAGDLGALVLLDVKRGDIGSTMQAYADAYLDPSSPLAVDAITVSPFLGTGSLQPAFDAVARHGTGVFVLALTSNPEGSQVQHARTSRGTTVAGAVLAALRRLNAEATEAGRLGSYGAVVGATIGATNGATNGATHEELAIGGPLLVPGVGAQGGTPESVRATFGSAITEVLPSTSRALLAAGPDPGALRDAAAGANATWADALRDPGSLRAAESAD